MLPNVNELSYGRLRSSDAELDLAVGRTMISFTSTSAGCSIANAIARAIASGGIANLSRDSASLAFTSGFVTDSAKFVRTKPGEMIVTRSLSPASWRKPSEMASPPHLGGELPKPEVDPIRAPRVRPSHRAQPAEAQSPRQFRCSRP